MNFWAAVREGDVDAVGRCLESGTHVDPVAAYGRTPLFSASFRGHDGVVQQLIAAGADLNHTDTHGRTALMLATLLGHTTVVDTLLNAGANPHDADTSGTTALMHASKTTHADVIQRLVAADATPRQDLTTATARTTALPRIKRREEVPVVALVSLDRTRTNAFGDAWSCAAAAPGVGSGDEDLRTASVRLMDEPSAFPCHLAVLSSKGDLAQFCDAASVSEDDANANANMKMKIDVLDTTTSRQKICATEYAYLLGYDGIGEVLLSRMDNPSLVVQRTPALSVQLIENATDTNEYVCVIHETHGDVVQCQRYLCAVDDTSHSLDARFEVEVVRQRREPMAWSAVDLASHLGYDAVVEYLIKKTCRHLPIKERFALVDHAVEQAAKWAAVELGKK